MKEVRDGKAVVSEEQGQESEVPADAVVFVADTSSPEAAAVLNSKPARNWSRPVSKSFSRRISASLCPASMRWRTSTRVAADGGSIGAASRR